MAEIKYINPHYQKGIRFSQIEIYELVKAWILLGLAFTIAMSGLKFELSFLISLVISLLTIGIGFLFHELAHKFLAQRYGCFAEFRSFDTMLLMALVMSFFGFVFAAPGAVMIQGHLTRRQNGTISAAGPAMNMVVSGVFLALALTATLGTLKAIGVYGFRINAWLALFNMIPFAMFDGKKIWDWNKAVYIIMAVVGLGLVALSNILVIGTA
jgi:Zn-dependent protease